MNQSNPCRSMEFYLLGYLNAVMQKTRHNIRLTYLTSWGPPKTFQGASRDGPIEECSLSILSPEFFTRVMHYNTLSDALIAEGIAAPEKSRTVLVDGLDIVLRPMNEESSDALLNKQHGLLDAWRWNAVRYLRCAPLPLAYSSKTQPAKDESQVAHGKLSSLDMFWMEREEGKAYRRAVLRSFLARRLAFGFVELLDAADIVIRLSLIYQAVCNPSDIWKNVYSTVWWALKRQV